LLSGESSSLSVHGVYCGVSRRLNDLSIEPGDDQFLGLEEVASLAVDSGLTQWLIQKAT
jgi:hypothetical protein